MYTEEELLEAVDILVEDYGFDEDYAIDLVLESYEEELYEMDLYNEMKNPFSGYKAARNDYKKSKDEWKSALDVATKEQRVGTPRSQAISTQNYVDKTNNLINSGKRYGKETAKIAVPVGAAAVGGAIAYKAYKKHKKNKQETDNRRRSKLRRRSCR